MKQLTKDEAIAFHDSREWESWTDDQIAAFQIDQKFLCVPFSRFHEAMEKALDRPVWTHEFANSDRLRDEMNGKIPKATFEDIVNLLPPEKTVVVVHNDK